MLRHWLRVLALLGCIIGLGLLLGLFAALVTGKQAHSDGLHDLAATVWAESRSEPFEGQLGVAFVAINRLECCPDKWGRTISQVVRRKHQFSVWTGRYRTARLERLHDGVPGFKTAKHAAFLAMTGRAQDPTAGALFFTTARMKPPSWTKGLIAQRIGNHVFYRLKGRFK